MTEIDEAARESRRTRRPDPVRTTVVGLVVAVATLAGALVLGRSPAPAPTPGPAPSSTAAPSRAAFDLGPPGTLIVGRVTGPRLVLVRSSADGGETTFAMVPSLDDTLGDWGLSPVPVAAISSTGTLAVAVRQLPSGNQATAIIDLAHPGSKAAIVDAGAFAFLPDGTLVVQPTESPGTILRFPAPYTGPGQRTIVSFPVELPALSLLADGSGAYGVRPVQLSDHGRVRAVAEVIVGWDGTTRDADPAVDPLLATGLERLVGAAGETATAWRESNPSVEGGGIAIVSPEAARVNVPIEGSLVAWLPEGRRLVAVEASGGLVTQYTLAIWDGMDVTRRALTFEPESIVAFAGLTADVAVFRTDDLRVWRINLDGSSAGVAPGFVVGIVR